MQQHKTKKKNFREDFKLFVDLGEHYNGEGFSLSFYTDNTSKRYVCEYDGVGAYRNCLKVDERHVLCLFDNHGLTPGVLKVDILRRVPDDQMPDGVLRLADTFPVLTTDEESGEFYGVEITRGKSDNPLTSESTLLLLANVIQGRAFTYEDFTPEQIEYLREPAKNAGEGVIKDYNKNIVREFDKIRTWANETSIGFRELFEQLSKVGGDAMDAAEAANTAASKAEGTAEAANTAAANAQSAARSASMSGGLANGAAEVANTAAEAANTAAAGANEAGREAIRAAQQADAIKSKAQEATSAANTAASGAERAADIANRAGQRASAQGAAAEAAAEAANEAAKRAEDSVHDLGELTEKVGQVEQEVGNLENLQTEAKSNLVDAINEAATKGGNCKVVNIIEYCPQGVHFGEHLPFDADVYIAKGELNYLCHHRIASPGDQEALRFLFCVMHEGGESNGYVSFILNDTLGFAEFEAIYPPQEDVPEWILKAFNDDLRDKMGDLSALQTTAKGNLVEAINDNQKSAKTALQWASSAQSNANIATETALEASNTANEASSKVDELGSKMVTAEDTEGEPDEVEELVSILDRKADKTDVELLGHEVGQLKENQTTIADIERAMQSLPDGSAVSAQVAVNTRKTTKIEQEVFGNEIEINLSTLPITKRTLSSTGAAWGSASSTNHVVVEAKSGDTFVITASENSSSYCFLKEYDATIIGDSGSTPPVPQYATGYNKPIWIAVNEEIIVSAPTDSVVLYLSNIASLGSSYKNTLPKSVVMKGQSDGLVNRVEHIEKSIIKKREINVLNVYDKEVINCAYSGLGIAPMNSYEHFIKACRTGKYNAIKADMQLTADGKIILCHDKGFTINLEGRISANYNSQNSINIHDYTAEYLTSLEYAATYPDIEGYCHPCLLENMLAVCKSYGVIPFLTLRADSYREQTISEMILQLKKFSLESRAIINLFPNGIQSAVFSGKYAPKIISNYTMPQDLALSESIIDEAADLGISSIMVNAGAISSVNDNIIIYAIERGVRIGMWYPELQEDYENCVKRGFSLFQIKNKDINTLL